MTTMITLLLKKRVKADWEITIAWTRATKKWPKGYGKVLYTRIQYKGIWKNYGKIGHKDKAGYI